MSKLVERKFARKLTQGPTQGKLQGLLMDLLQGSGVVLCVPECVCLFDGFLFCQC